MSLVAVPGHQGLNRSVLLNRPVFLRWIRCAETRMGLDFILITV